MKEIEEIVKQSIQSVLPDQAVKRALSAKEWKAPCYLVAIGKAAWQMARAAAEVLGEQLKQGIVITKYHHVKGEIPRVCCYEAGHPIPDDNTYRATNAVISFVTPLTEKDQVLLLLSGGGSSLFEQSLLPGNELEKLTTQLLSCGADIVEMNTIRKRFSAVKGGKFAQLCAPASVYQVVLSDVLGDRIDMVASGPACADSSTSEEAAAIVKKYGLQLSDKAKSILQEETPKSCENVESVLIGSVRELCKKVEETCKQLGYETVYLTDQLSCEAREAGAFLGAIAKSHQGTKRNLAFIAGGETVVHVTGSGKGGRNQELVLAAADEIAGLQDTYVFSFGSDGTDGPTDAAGGWCSGASKKQLQELGMDLSEMLQQNNAYEALRAINGLILTGATGTNVNDVSVVLIRREGCTICPRECHVNREAGEMGVCGVTGANLFGARAALHMWEEPCISGIQGSGTVFFSGCPLRCVYCQNHQIAAAQTGMEMTKERLVEIFFELQEKGAHNINLVTPTHYTPQIVWALQEAKARGLHLPVVYNCSGYEKVETLRMIEGLVDIYLTDFKYMETKLAAAYSKAPDYPQIAKEALQEMVRQHPKCVFDEEGMMKSGVIVRHLLLPNHVKNAKAVVKYVYETYGNSVYLSLMNQYTPLPQVSDIPDLNRHVTKREYEKVIDYALELGVENAFVQEGVTAKESFIPLFDCEGISPCSNFPSVLNKD